LFVAFRLSEVEINVVKKLPAILFAEDSPDDVALIKIGFAKVKFPLPVHFVEDGIGAVEYLEGKNQYADREKYPLPSMLLTDLKMPRMDGFELLDWIRSREQFKKLPVIVVTGSNQIEDRSRAIERGASAYVIKGLLTTPPASLFDAIVQFIDQPADIGKRRLRMAAPNAVE
jgi:CheY-like chemotaxis protein